MSTLIQNLEDLFDQIARHEIGKRDFSEELFVERLKGIIASFELLRNEPELSRQVDSSLNSLLRNVEPSRSPLRYLVSHTLAIFLEARAHGTSESYEYLLRSRIDSARLDADFIEKVLMLQLLSFPNLRRHRRIGLQLLLLLADFMETLGAPAPELEAAGQSLRLVPSPKLLLEFARRHQRFPGVSLTERHDNVEYRLKQDKFFDWMSNEGRRQGLETTIYLQGLGLMPSPGVLTRVLQAIGNWFSRLAAGLNATFESVYGSGAISSIIVFLVALVLVIGAPTFWVWAYRARLEKFRTNAAAAATRPIDSPPVASPAPDR